MNYCLNSESPKLLNSKNKNQHGDLNTIEEKQKSIMNTGRKICKALKEVRMQVADANGIRYAPTECHYEGECTGTCPKCEGEVRWLEQQLLLRRQLGKAVAVVGVSMGLAALTACNTCNRTPQVQGEVGMPPDTFCVMGDSVDADAIDLNDAGDSLPASGEDVSANEDDTIN